MKLFVVMFMHCLFVGNILAGAEKNADRKLSLVELIVESDEVNLLSGFEEGWPVWELLAGVRLGGFRDWSSPVYALGEDRMETIKQYLKTAKKNEKFSAGSLFLYFNDRVKRGRSYFYLRNSSAEFYSHVVSGPIAGCAMVFPEYDGLRDDILWLCKNRYLLKQLKQGRLTAAVYHFSAHELEFLVRICPEEYLKKLHAYAKTDLGGDKLRRLYQFLEYNPTDSKRFPLLDEVTVERFAAVIDEDVDIEVMFGTPVTSLKLLEKKMLSNGYFTQRDQLLLRTEFMRNSKANGLQIELSGMLKNEIIEKGDLGLLRTLLQRMERRESIADLTVLAELVESKRFLEGSEEFQELVMEQFSQRKEKEVVWILAPLIKHVFLSRRARKIMQEFTLKDLGDEAEDWREWYKEESE